MMPSNIRRISGRAAPRHDRIGPTRVDGHGHDATWTGADGSQPRPWPTRGSVGARRPPWLGDPRAYRFELRRDRNAVQECDRGEQRPEEERDEAGQRSVRLAERGAQQEEPVQREGHHDDERDGQRPLPRRARTSRADAGAGSSGRCMRSTRSGGRTRAASARHPRRRSREALQGTTPIARPSAHRFTKAPHASDTCADREDEGATVLPQRRPVALDPVDPIHRALDLAEQGGPGDQSAPASPRIRARDRFWAPARWACSTASVRHGPPVRGRHPGACPRSRRSRARRPARSRVPRARSRPARGSATWRTPSSEHG